MENNISLEDLDNFQRELIQAFPPQDYPGDNEIVKPQWLADPTSEEFELWECLHGKRWTDLDKELLNRVDSLALVEPKAFRYYLPAFILEAVKAISMSQSVRSCALYALMPSSRPEGLDYKRKRLLPFAEEQRACVLKFLQFSKQNHLIIGMSEINQAEKFVTELWKANPSSA